MTNTEDRSPKEGPGRAAPQHGRAGDREPSAERNPRKGQSNADARLRGAPRLRSPARPREAGGRMLHLPAAVPEPPPPRPAPTPDPRPEPARPPSRPRQGAPHRDPVTPGQASRCGNRPGPPVRPAGSSACPSRGWRIGRNPSRAQSRGVLRLSIPPHVGALTFWKSLPGLSPRATLSQKLRPQPVIGSPVNLQTPPSTPPHSPGVIPVPKEKWGSKEPAGGPGSRGGQGHGRGLQPGTWGLGRAGRESHLLQFAVRSRGPGLRTSLPAHRVEARATSPPAGQSGAVAFRPRGRGGLSGGSPGVLGGCTGGRGPPESLVVKCLPSGNCYHGNLLRWVFPEFISNSGF